MKQHQNTKEEGVISPKNKTHLPSFPKLNQSIDQSVNDSSSIGDTESKLYLPLPGNMNKQRLPMRRTTQHHFPKRSDNTLLRLSLPQVHLNRSGFKRRISQPTKTDEISTTDYNT